MAAEMMTQVVWKTDSRILSPTVWFLKWEAKELSWPHSYRLSWQWSFSSCPLHLFEFVIKKYIVFFFHAVTSPVSSSHRNNKSFLSLPLPLPLHQNVGRCFQKPSNYLELLLRLFLLPILTRSWTLNKSTKRDKKEVNPDWFHQHTLEFLCRGGMAMSVWLSEERSEDVDNSSRFTDVWVRLSVFLGGYRVVL